MQPTSQPDQSSEPTVDKPSNLTSDLSVELGSRVRFTRRAAQIKGGRPHRGATTFDADRLQQDRGISLRQLATDKKSELHTKLPLMNGRGGNLTHVVVEWPEDGEGVVVGTTRVGTGRSIYMGYEEGYEFDKVSFQKVYEVKHHLDRKPYLVPLDAVEVIR